MTLLYNGESPDATKEYKFLSILSDLVVQIIELVIEGLYKTCIELLWSTVLYTCVCVWSSLSIEVASMYARSKLSLRNFSSVSRVTVAINCSCYGDVFYLGVCRIYLLRQVKFLANINILACCITWVGWDITDREGYVETEHYAYHWLNHMSKSLFYSPVNLFMM